MSYNASFKKKLKRHEKLIILFLAKLPATMTQISKGCNISSGTTCYFMQTCKEVGVVDSFQATVKVCVPTRSKTNQQKGITMVITSRKRAYWYLTDKGYELARDLNWLM